MLKRMFRLFIYIKERLLPARRVEVLISDDFPVKMPTRNLVLLREESGKDWSIGMKCPCGCSRVIELMLIHEARPRWDVGIDDKGIPTLSPSVWLKDGCKSHFWLRKGRVVWCK